MKLKMNSFFRGSLSPFQPSAFRFPPSASGSALVLVLLITALLATVAVSFLSTSRIEQIAAKNFTRQNAAAGLAEMATQQAMAKIQQGFTVNGTGATIITTQPGAIWQYTFSSGTCNAVTGKNPVELFSTNGTINANLNNLQNPGNTSALTSNNSNNAKTITGNASELILVPMENITSNGTVIGRVAYFVDDEGTKINLNSSTGDRTVLNAANPRPFSLDSLTSFSWGNTFNSTLFSNVINGIGSSNNSSSDSKNWSYFYRPEQLFSLGVGLNASNTPAALFSTAMSSANSTANMTHLLTPWGTQRIEINTLSTNATDGNGTASVNTIHAVLTNSTLTAIFGENFADKYTSIGVKQIAANMLQMRDPNTFSINASGNYSGALLGGTDLDANNIPREYLGYAPYPVISEIGFSCAFGYNIGIKISVQPTIELYNPYPVDFIFRSGYPRLIVKYSHFAVDINYTLTNGTTATKTFNSTISGDQLPFRYTSIPSGWNPHLNDGLIFYDALFEFLPRNADNLPYIPAMTKIQTRLGSINLGPRVHIEHFANDPPVLINSISNMTINIESVRLLANSNNGTGNIQSGQTTTIRDWVSGNETGWIKADISPNGVMPFLAKKDNIRSLPSINLKIPFNDNPPGNPPAVVPTNSASRISFFNRYPISTITPGVESNWFNPDPGAPTWSVNASTKWGNQGNSSSTNPNSSNSTTSSLSGMSIPSDPSFNNEVSSAVYASTNSSDMRQPFLATGNYTCPADLGFVPTNKRWRRLRMQMQPSAEGSLIPDWAMLDVISFGNSTDPNNAFNRMVPVNINGKFRTPGNATIAPRAIGIQALAKVLERSSGASILDPMLSASSNATQSPVPMDATRFKGNTINATTIANAIQDMDWAVNSAWDTRRSARGFPADQYILPSEIMEIAGVSDEVSQTDYNNSGSHFKWNEGRASALIPAVTTRSSFFTIYAYAQAGQLQNKNQPESASNPFIADSEALTKTLVEVEIITPATSNGTSTTPATYKVKKLYTQPIPLGQ